VTDGYAIDANEAREDARMRRTSVDLVITALLPIFAMPGAAAMAPKAAPAAA
jgi:hypothetical protein